jgi:hypothetical protein
MSDSPPIYKVVWSNEHNSGELPYEYVGFNLALEAGRAWEADMIAADDDPITAANEYQWEVIRVEPPIPPCREMVGNDK